MTHHDRLAQHTDTARAVARETGWNLDEYAAELEWSAVGIGPVGRSRDSEPLEESNYATAVAILADAGARFAEPTFGHWAVGWIGEIAYDAGDPATVAIVAGIAARMAAYPCLDEQDYSEREWSRNHPNGTAIGAYCFGSRDDDCHARPTVCLGSFDGATTAAGLPHPRPAR